MSYLKLDVKYKAVKLFLSFYLQKCKNSGRVCFCSFLYSCTTHSIQICDYCNELAMVFVILLVGLQVSPHICVQAVHQQSIMSHDQFQLFLLGMPTERSANYTYIAFLWFSYSSANAGPSVLCLLSISNVMLETHSPLKIA